MINEEYAKAYCSEDISKIQNYEQAVKDKTQTWHCHHRLEVQGQFRNSESLLKKCGLYYNVPAWQLVFLTKSEHRRLHRLGGHHSAESRKKMSEKAKLRAPISEETRKKMSMSRSGEKSYWFGKHLSDETRKKISLSLSGDKHPMFGKHGYWSGKHLSEETRKKQSDGIAVLKWWNNGASNKRSRECPGEGWVRGRLKRK